MNDIYNFKSLLKHLNHGKTIRELDDAYYQILDLLDQHGGKARIQLTINFTGHGIAGDLETVDISDDIKLTLPQARRSTVETWPRGSQLYLTDPRQETLNFDGLREAATR